MYSLKSLFLGVILVSIAVATYSDSYGPGFHNDIPDVLSPDMRILELSTRSIGYGGAETALTPDNPETAETSQAGPCQVTTDIEDLARSLDYDPWKIYEYVHNEIDYIPYHGSLRGPREPCWTKLVMPWIRSVWPSHYCGPVVITVANMNMGIYVLNMVSMMMAIRVWQIGGC